MSGKMTPAQEHAMRVLRINGVWYSGNGVTHATIRALESRGFVTVERSVRTWRNRRTGRFHSQLDWTARLVARKPVGEWRRVEPGHYVRVGSDGKTELAAIVKEPSCRPGGYYGPDEWVAYIYPKGNKGWCFVRRGYKTLKEARGCSEAAYRQAVADIDAGRPSEQ